MKSFCNKCGREITENYGGVLIPINLSKYLQIIFCRSCLEKFIDFLRLDGERFRNLIEEFLL